MVMKDPLLKMVGENIRRERLKLGISQESLASQADIHRTFLSSIERGERNISLVTLQKISNSLMVKTHSLLQDVNE